MERVPDPSATRSIHGPPRAGSAARASLFVVDGDSSSVVALPAEGIVVLGRDPEADVVLRDTAASRRHARIIVSSGEARVADLESRNGTRVNGQRVENARALESGDVIGIGEVSIVFHRRARASGDAAFVERPLFRERLRAETSRSLGFARPLSLIALALGGETSAREAIISAAAAELHPLHTASLGDDGLLLVLLPEAGEAAAANVATRLLRALAAVAPGAKAGVAACPADGCDGETLLEAAARAALGAPLAAVQRARETVSELAVGERTIIVADSTMHSLYELLRRLAQSDLPVLVCGETGAGKENAAFAVHSWSSRAAGPFVTLNCAALPDTLVESELFGYEKGAFSGATGAKQGLLEAASGGTIFLDEVGELPLQAQAKLLRVLESRRITRLGAVKERDLDLRIVAATNRELEGEVSAGRFRRDLFFRLGAAKVVLPPLRERPRELTVLAHRFLAAACERAGRAPLVFSHAVLRQLAAHDWPGNVRELKNLTEYLAATIAEGIAEPHHLPPQVRGPAAPVSASSVGEQAAIFREPESPPPPPEQPRRFRPIADELRDLERARMIEALDAADGVQKRAAELLAMPIRTFTLKYARYRLAGRERGGR